MLKRIVWEISADILIAAATPVQIGGKLLRDEGFQKEYVESGGLKSQTDK